MMMMMIKMMILFVDLLLQCLPTDQALSISFVVSSLSFFSHDEVVTFINCFLVNFCYSAPGLSKYNTSRFIYREAEMVPTFHH